MDIEEAHFGKGECPFSGCVGNNCRKCDMHDDCKCASASSSQSSAASASSSSSSSSSSAAATATPDELGSEPTDDQVGGDGGGVPVVDASHFERVLAMEAADDPAYTKTIHYGVTVALKRESDKVWMGAASAVLSGVTPAELFDLYWVIPNRRKWDTFFSKLEVVQEYPDGSQLFYTASWSPPLVAKRDFVQVRKCHTNSDGSIVAAFLPCTHESLPPKPGHVRGVVHFSGFVMRSVGPSQTKFTLVTYVDVGMPIRDWIIHRLTSMAARYYLSALKSAIKSS
ncbi:hypothetical protein Pelo_4827 [Pelomyxa schiedti]|nr:hypothetical protein Pelo_4827 [Pelomyxa schiedti]